MLRILIRSKRRCLELALLMTLINILLSFAIVLYSSTPAENSRKLQKLSTRLSPVTQSGVQWSLCSGIWESCVINCTRHFPLSENTFDNNPKVNPSELLSEVAKAVAKMPNPWWYFIPPLECLTSPASSRVTCSGWWGLVCCIFIPSSLPRSSDQCWPAEWDCGAGQELVWPNVNSSLCTWQRASCWSQVYSVSKVL